MRRAHAQEIVSAALLLGSTAALRALAQCQESKLTAQDAQLYSYFAWRLDVSDGVVLVASLRGHDAYAFEREGDAWKESAAISSTDPNDPNGSYDVAISGPLALVAHGWGRAVSAWRRTADGWLGDGHLAIDENDPEGHFGEAVAVSGLTALAGAPGDNDNGFFAGAAYVFERSGDGVWAQSAKLLAADGDGNDEFGYAVDIDGDVAVVGAHWDDDAGLSAGSAYVFERDAGGAWVQTAKLLGHDTDSLDQFGSAVAVWGGTIVVGAFGSRAAPDVGGAVYVFDRSSQGGWTQRAQLFPEPPVDVGYFGHSVAIEGDRLVVGASADHRECSGCGAVYVFERGAEGAWSQVARLRANDASEDDRLGYSVALAGSTVVAGAPQPFTGSTVGTGKAYVFDLSRADCNGNGWCDDVDISTGFSEDVDFDGAPDECQPDCNGNGRPDDWEIAAGLATDCDADGVPDECTLGVFSHHAPLVAPFEAGQGVVETLIAPPAARGDVTFRAQARSDLDLANETADFVVNGATLATLFDQAGFCTEPFDSDACVVPADEFNRAVLDGDAVVRLRPSGGVAGCSGSFARWTLRYDFGVLDCNGNGVIDTCDIADGTLTDANADGRPDECPPAPCPGDLDGDRWVATSDLAALLSHFGLPSGMALADGDLDGDGDVDLADLSALLGEFGLACP